MDPFDSSPGIDSDAAFNLTVQISQFTAKLDDGSTVDVQRKCIKWVVDYCTYTLDKLEKDLAARVNWGSCQRPKISEFDMSTFEERELMDETSLALAFSNRMAEKTLMLFVDVEEKDIELISASIVTEGAQSNVVADNASALVASSNQTEVAHVIDWDSLHIVPIAKDQIGTLASVMDEDAMYAFVGLRVEDETTEKERQDVDAENENGAGTENTEGAAYGTGNTDGEDLLVDDIIPGEESAFYDMEDPPMIAGTTYANMKEFRAAVRQHAIKAQFELGTEKSCKVLFRGYCKAEGCPWAIVARLMNDGKQVRVNVKKNEHFCSSIGKVRTKMASFHWVAEKAIPFLTKEPNMGAKKLQKELEDKYQVKIGYGTVWAGREIAAEKIHGSWEDSFGLLFNFKAEVQLRMPGSIVEIDLEQKEDGVYFKRFFCCFKPSIDGFLNGCRPYLSIDSTALNGRWNGHLPSATGIDGHNWIFPLAFGFFDSETTYNWTWFMWQLQKAIRNPPHLAISSDACKGIENAVKKVFPWAEHRECFVHLIKNFLKQFQGPVFGRMYPAARTFQPEYNDYLMKKLYAANKKVQPWLDHNHKLLWSRSKFSEEIKCDHITNNVAEVWNKWVKDIKDLPVAELADTLRSKFMELYARRRRIGEKLASHIMLPIVVRQLHAMSRQLGHLKVLEGGRNEAEVTEVTATHKVIRHVVNLEHHTCSCREWDVSGKPCPHALALIITYRNPKMEDYMHPYYSVNCFRLAYAGVIKPLPDKTQWAQVDLGFKVMPPLAKRAVGRQRKNRIPGCLENKGNNPRTKGVFQVQCKTCLEFGHRSSSPKCCFNGPKKRKSRAKKQGAPRGSNKRKKTAAKNPSPEPENEISTTPTRPVTRSQLQLTVQDGARTHVVAACTNSPGPVTRSMQLAVLDGEGTSKSPAKKRTPRLTKFPAKKITPRKGKN